MIIIIIDANAWCYIFNTTLPRHIDFLPVRNCITKRQVKIAWGGTVYIREIKKCFNYLKIHAELDRSRVLEPFNTSEIDQISKQLKKIEPNTKFNDPHIVALQIVSKAKVICTGDKQSHPFITNRKLYPKGHNLAKIYSKRNHSKMLFA